MLFWSVEDESHMPIYDNILSTGFESETLLDET